MTYTVKQEKFEGPLDVLLELIHAEKLSINEISLAAVTDDFIGYVNNLNRRVHADPEVVAEFVVIAAELLLIKSRSLLPNFHTSSEEEASLQELQERLAEYQRLRELAAIMGGRARGGPQSFSRQAHAGRSIQFSPPTKFTREFLVTAFRSLAEIIPKAERLVEEKIQRIISLEEKISELHAFLRANVERAFSELVSGAREKIEVIVSFLAVLELAKQKLISVRQPGLFQDITIRSRGG